MSAWLDADQVAERIGVSRRTAMARMLEMNPSCVGGNVRKRYRVSEENLEKWLVNRSQGRRSPVSRIGTGSNKKLQRR